MLNRLLGSSGSSPVDLGSVMPSGQSSDASRAVAVNNLANPQVVGWNDTADKALLWEHQGGSTWTVLDLTTSAAIGPSNADFALGQAQDLDDMAGSSAGVFAITDSAIR
jgi:hypothetical protein